MNDPSVFHFFALVVVLSLAVYMDLRERRIPNSVTVPGLVLALAMAIFMEGGFPLGALAGAAVALGVTLPLVALGGIGAGDAKLLVAVGAFVGPAGLFSVLVYGGLAGGVLAIANAIRRGAIVGVLVNLKNLIVNWITLGRHGQRISLRSPGAQSIPYALPIAAGALMTWFFPIWLGGSP